MEAVRETAGVTMRAILRYVRAQAGDAAVRRVLDAAGEHEDASVYEDPRRWWSYDTKIALFTAAAQLLDDEAVATKVGQSILQHTLHAPLRVGLLMLGGPAQVIRLIAKTSSKFNAAADMSALHTSRGTATLEYRLRAGNEPHRYDCEYTQGLLTQIPALFGLPPATVTQDACQVQGAPSCLYTIRWKQHGLVSWWRRKRGDRPVDDSVGDVIAAQLDMLQRTVGELVGAQQAERALAVVADRASTAVEAHALLLVARAGPDRPAQIHGFGLSDDEIARITAQDHPGDEPEVGRIVVDIASGTRYYGYLVAYFDHVMDFERRLLEAYANLAAVALDSLSALETAAERQQAAERLLSLARSLTFASTPQEVAQVTVRAAHAVMRADTAAVLLVGDDMNLRVAAHLGHAEEHHAALDRLVIAPEDTDRLAEVFSGAVEARVYDSRTTDPFILGILRTFRMEHVAVVSIQLPERVYGILVASFNGEHGALRSRQFGERMAGVADQAATVLRTCELLSETWRMAHADPLTGLANRRAFIAELTQAVGTGDGAVLYIDLDHFKAVNDTFGHGAGDELLGITAQRLLACTRAGDMVARLGGDEFVVLSRGTGDVADLAARISAAFTEPVSLAGTVTPVHASVGGTAFSAGEQYEDVLHRADTAMYSAKHARLLRAS